MTGRAAAFPARALACAAAAMILAAGCNARGGGGGSGRLLLADQGSIVRYDIASRATTLLVAPVGGNGVALRDPAPSPDGRRIAYVRVAPATDGHAQAALWVAAADGRDPHPVLQAPGVSVAHPQWLDDATIVAAVHSPAGTAVERIDAATGARAALVGGALDVALSRDRARIATVRPGPAGVPELSLADASGRNAQPVTGTPAWSAVEALAFAPDGRSVAVAAQPRAGTAAVQIWLIGPGAAPRPLATLDAPVAGLTFGPDGATLFVLSLTALDAVSVRDGAVRTLRGAAGAGGLAWTP